MTLWFRKRRDERLSDAEMERSIRRRLCGRLWPHRYATFVTIDSWGQMVVRHRCVRCYEQHVFEYWRPSKDSAFDRCEWYVGIPSRWKWRFPIVSRRAAR
jgi:hypothetical protein